MARSQSVQKRLGDERFDVRDDDLSLDDWMARRNTQVARRDAADSAGRQVWTDAIRTGQDVVGAQPSDVRATGMRALSKPAVQGNPSHGYNPDEPRDWHGRWTTGAGAASSKPIPSSVGHPGFAESLIPVWGSGREAVADFQEGKYAGAALNGALAASDLFLAESIAKGLAKGGFYFVRGAGEGAYDWSSKVRPWMGKKGRLAPRQHGHHWAIPQNGWGKQVPDAIKNQPWNIKPMPSPEVHGRITNPYKGKPRFNIGERYWHGTPAWSKVATGGAVGHPAAAAKARSDQRK